MKSVTFYRALTFLSFGVFLCFSGCKKTSESASENLESSKEVKKIVILTWEEYFAPEVIKSFESSSGMKVELVGYENLDQMKGLLRSQAENFDLVITDDSSIPSLVELKLISELDHKRLPNKGKILASHLDRPIDPGNRFTIPYVWGTGLVTYRADRISDPEHSWDILWDPALKGKIAMIDERSDIYAAALLRAKHSLNSQDPEHLNEATEMLLQQIRELDPIYTDVIEARELMLKGEVWVMLAYSCDAALDATKDENIRYFIPKEGASIWMDSFAIPRLAPNVDGAHAFIDFLCRPEVAAENANYIRYIPPIQGTEHLLDIDLAADEGLNPPIEIVERCESLAPPTVERQEILNQGMKRIFDQIRAKKMAKSPSEGARPTLGGTAFVPAED